MVLIWYKYIIFQNWFNFLLSLVDVKSEPKFEISLFLVMVLKKYINFVKSKVLFHSLLGAREKASLEG